MTYLDFVYFCGVSASNFIITETSPYKSDPRFPPSILLKWGKFGVGIKMVKCEKNRYFSIKSYVVDVY